MTAQSLGDATPSQSRNNRPIQGDVDQHSAYNLAVSFAEAIMARRISWLCWPLGFLLAASSASADYRVVVQEAQRHRYQAVQLTPDARYAWVVTGANDHVLQVIDVAGPAVLRRFYLPDRIQSATIDTASGKLAVSTNRSIYLGSLTQEHLDEILPDVNGVVLLQEKGPVLAVLGQIPDPEKKKKVRFSYFGARALGVFDLAKKEWRFVRTTPIVVPHLDQREGGGFPLLLFHEGTVLAGGIGGSVGSMIPITYSTDVRLDLTSGKAKITTGPSSRFGKVVEEKEPNLPLPDPRDPAHDKNVEMKHDRQYGMPEPLRKAHQSYTEAI